MRVDLDVAQHQLSWSDLLERVRFAEAAGFEGAWVFDHFQPLYGDRLGPCLEGWTLLAALAAATRRLRLGTLVTSITHRSPAVLAAEAVTVDQVSGGRLELGLGAGWFQREHQELGLPFPPARERIERLEEGINVIRLLMTTDNAMFQGRYYQLDHATYRPRPAQQPHPPIWVGGSGERLMLPLVGRLADAWHADGSYQDLERKSRIVSEAAARAGRDPAAILRSASLSISEPWDRVRAEVDRLRGLGFSCLVVGWPSEGRGRLEQFVERFLPELTAA